MFAKLKHGLSGSFFHADNGDRPVNLQDTRGVGIRIEGLNKYFGGNHVLKDINLEIKAGETFCIIGPSGTGKSVLLFADSHVKISPNLPTDNTGPAAAAMNGAMPYTSWLSVGMSNAPYQGPWQ